MRETINRLGFALGQQTLAAAALAELEQLFSLLPYGRPGTRIDPLVAERTAAVRLATAEIGAIIGADARPVRSLLFDKSEEANWSLGWHQDRTIEVAAEAKVAGYGPFTVKQGRLHVAPPIELVEQMLTVRIHLDPVDEGNAPLVVAPGSHRCGYIAEPQISEVIARCGEAVCTAESGMMWYYATPILHRSARSTGRWRRRRVLQLDFAACSLPDGLSWARDVTTA